jgi:hypothetical protein
MYIGSWVITQRMHAAAYSGTPALAHPAAAAAIIGTNNKTPTAAALSI